MKEQPISTMTHDQAAELLGAFALDAVEADERAAMEVHLETCDECRAELCSHWETLATLWDGGDRPPITTWAAISEWVGAGPAEAEAPASPPVTRLRTRRRRWEQVLAAAAVLALALLSLDVLVLRSREPSVEAAYGSALRSPDARQARLAAGGQAGQATLVLLPDGRGYLAATGLPDASPGRTYQLWALSGSRLAPVSAGVLGRHLEVVAFHYAGPVDSFALSQEADGGAPAPTSIVLNGPVGSPPAKG